ncbi:hypothetical protein CO051_04835 [Candidatus Roizmanbacteria bacterium CG_4_9_14_0_2_um_filter_39_13]|uniref:Uncharacterized protein n=2 Tax=Candidatus Roizmaniibacteriota TaxID=1752723 RepID=A0A2M8EXL5_9BACT|nr:MAG: hypothetical protein COY15_04890 [Candidatus Roizmanbacteria bacterium CG_4_10_14_0_2_um_filter_39_12]PJC30819.1 MAG: hypothetical protein CO051_04835 [Candidatus Roizmanbacteria bacterium CG_4_9_14_0_2_um_filter_39_13]PJE62252.1 MAG: hypothetical protein COU87_00240 [Candidatus Roizmanbacteria bacterium CG10_big_fil_rev_8_21_14_0_10_39_12]
MKKNVTATIKTYNDTWNMPIKPYEAIDFNGKKITIQPKNKLKHESSHPVEQMPTYFYNLGSIVANPDCVIESTSSNPTAVKNSKKGKHYIYKKEGYVISLDIPGQLGQNEETLVVVFYGVDGINYTRTYRTGAKST